MDAKKHAGSQPLRKEHPPAAYPQAAQENRLRRQTPFLCTIRFRNTLPEVACEPKLLVTPLQPERLAAYSLTDLERTAKRDVIFEQDLGVPISLLDTTPYAVPDEAVPLAPEDAALLDADDGPVLPGAAAAAAPGGRGHERLRGARAEVSWLMRTQYISADTPDKRPGATPGKRPRPEAEEPEDTLEGQIAAIEAGFEAAQQRPVHGTNPALEPVEVLPVLPDFERWANHYTLIAFDTDPTADHDALAGLATSQRRSLAERAIAKSYRLGDADELIAYMLPTRPPAADGASTSDMPPIGGDYEWVREYSFKRGAGDDRTLWLRFGSSHCTYAGIRTRLALHKRAKVGGGGGARGGVGGGEAFAHPSRVRLKRRAPGPAEENETRQRRAELLGEEPGPEQDAGILEDSE